MQLETERLTLRSFREENVDAMAQLFANPDFMRFSLGVFTKRKQTVAFIQKVMAWDRAGIPSQFAVVPRGEEAIIGYCGFFYHPEHAIEDIEIGYRLNPDYWNWTTAFAVFLQFMRYVLNDSLAWTEEIATYCLVAVVFVGSAMCVRLGRHIQVDLIFRYLPPALRECCLPRSMSFALFSLPMRPISSGSS